MAALNILGIGDEEQQRSLLGIPAAQVLDISPPNADRPVEQRDALAGLYNNVTDYIKRERQRSSDMGLWNDETGLPTGKGLLSAAQQTANALLMGTAAPGARFQLDPYRLKASDNLTAAERDAVAKYGEAALYWNNVHGTPEAEPTRKLIDAAIGKSELADNATLYRGVAIPTEIFEKSYKPGSIIEGSPGYVSTSARKDVAERFIEDYQRGETPVFMEMRVPRGRSAMHLETDPVAEAELGGPQHEVLLPRGSKFKVESIQERSNGVQHVVLVPHAGD